MLLLRELEVKKQSDIPKKNNKSIVFLNYSDIASFIERCRGQSTAIQNEATKETMKKRTAAPSKLNNEYFNIVLFWFFFF